MSSQHDDSGWREGLTHIIPEHVVHDAVPLAEVVEPRQECSQRRLFFDAKNGVTTKKRGPKRSEMAKKRRREVRRER